MNGGRSTAETVNRPEGEELRCFPGVSSARIGAEPTARLAGREDRWRQQNAVDGDRVVGRSAAPGLRYARVRKIISQTLVRHRDRSPGVSCMRFRVGSPALSVIVACSNAPRTPEPQPARPTPSAQRPSRAPPRTCTQSRQARLHRLGPSGFLDRCEASVRCYAPQHSATA
jgi:hypothetical protein